MKKAILCVTMAGLASGVIAQDFSLSIIGPSEVTEGAVFTIEVIGGASVGTHMLGGGFSLVTNSSLIENITWNPALWSGFNEDNEGYLGNGNYGQVVFGQLLLPIPGFDIPAAGSELGSAIGSFQITMVQFGLGAINFDLVAGSPFTLESVDVNAGLETYQDTEGTLTLNGHMVYGPTPSSVGLLAFGGLAASRRRR